MSAAVTVRLFEGPLAASSTAEAPPGAGAVWVFEGRVRPEEDGRSLTALRYEAYPPMTTRQLEALAEEVRLAHGVFALHVEHSTARVPVGEVSFRLTVHSAHRKAGLAAADAFIDRMKRDVALWKTPLFAGEAEAARGG
ncbi:MAG: molybdenum cofactor biosynthesis protein MoaE [Planctomycetota bacterium]